MKPEAKHILPTSPQARLSIERKLWAIAFRGTDRSNDPFLIFESWDEDWPVVNPTIPGTPIHPLLFVSRRIARAWCAAHLEKWKRNPAMTGWRVWPVRVIQKVVARGVAGNMEPGTKRFRSVAALVRHLTPETADRTIRAMRNAKARDRRKAKKLGITLTELYLREG